MPGLVASEETLKKDLYTQETQILISELGINVTLSEANVSDEAETLGQTSPDVIVTSDSGQCVITWSD